MFDTIEAATEEHYQQARRLIEEYARSLNVDLEFQGFSKELATLAEKYGPPRGAMILVRNDDVFVGCVGLKALPEGRAEVKRMFVQPEFRGRGLGRLLLEAFISKARDLGYRAIRLDTVPAAERSLILYRKYGFEEIEPYCYNPAPDAIFMELEL